MSLQKDEKSLEERRDAVRKILARAKVARIRYAQKKAKELGITEAEYLENKKARAAKARLAQRKKALLYRKNYERVRALRIKEAQSKPLQIKWQTFAVRIKNPKKSEVEKMQKKFDLLFKWLISIAKEEKLGHYNGNEVGIFVNDFVWYFDSTDSRRFLKLVYAKIKRYVWAKGIILSSHIFYTDESDEYVKIVVK
jgi:hypothetical protein